MITFLSFNKVLEISDSLKLYLLHGVKLLTSIINDLPYTVSMSSKFGNVMEVFHIFVASLKPYHPTLQMPRLLLYSKIFLLRSSNSFRCLQSITLSLNKSRVCSISLISVFIELSSVMRHLFFYLSQIFTLTFSPLSTSPIQVMGVYNLRSPVASQCAMTSFRKFWIFKPNSVEFERKTMRKLDLTPAKNNGEMV